MKRLSLRRSHSMRVGVAGKTQKTDNDDPPQQQALRQTREKKADISIDPGGACPDSRGEDMDMPPQLAKLGSSCTPRRARRVQSSRMRQHSSRLFNDSASQSHHGAVSRDKSGALEASAAGGAGRGGAAGPPKVRSAEPGAWSPNRGHEEPVQFQKLQKPAGWQEEQAVEIRRDWIAFLANGMGIDAKGATGAGLEALVVRRMLEQAEADLFDDSFDEWETDDEDEEDGLDTRREGGFRRNIITKGRRSRSTSRPRDPRATSLVELGNEDDGASSGTSGSGLSKRRRPRGGVLGFKLLHRSQTTGDMDSPPPKAGVSARQDYRAGHAERAIVDQRNHRDASVRRGGRIGGVLHTEGLLREESVASRAASRRPRYVSDSSMINGDTSTDSRRSSSRSRGTNDGGERGKRERRHELSGSSRSRERTGSDRIPVARLEQWRERLVGRGTAPVKDETGKVSYQGDGDDGKKRNEHQVSSNGSSLAYRRCNSSSGGGPAAGQGARRHEPGELTSTGLLGSSGDAGGKRGGGSRSIVPKESFRKGKESRQGHDRPAASSYSAYVSGLSQNTVETGGVSAALPLPRAADRNGGNVAKSEEATMSAAIQAATNAANSVSFSEEDVVGGTAERAWSAASAGADSAAGVGRGDQSRRAIGTPSRAPHPRGRRQADSREDQQQRARRWAERSATTRQHSTKETASEPRVPSTATVVRSPASRRGTEASLSSKAFFVKAAAAGASASRARGGLDDPAPLDKARLVDCRPSGNSGSHPTGVRHASGGSTGSRMNIVQQGVGGLGPSSRHPKKSPGPSSYGARPGCTEDLGGDKGLARAAAAAVARAVATDRAASATEGAVDDEDIFMPERAASRSFAQPSGTPFRVERRRILSDSQEWSSPQRRPSTSKARPITADPASALQGSTTPAGTRKGKLSPEAEAALRVARQKSRGRSRERHGKSVEEVAGASVKRESDPSRSVVQNTGAAAAAAAAADDGGYGSDWDKLEMHRAVYASDKPRLRQFMQARPQGLKQADHHGNTPLLLALKLGRTEMAWLMVRAGAELDVPSDGSFHLLDEAIVHGDEDLLVEIYGRLQRQSWARWRAKVPDLLSLLNDSIPDFYMEMHWSFECSNVLAPLVKAVAPHDHYRIWKKGSWLRMDSTITGYTKRLKTQRGKVSLLFLGKDSPSPGTLIKLDHGKKKIYNVLRRLESPTPSEVRRTCKRYLTAGHSKRPAMQVDAYVIKSGELNFKPVTDFSGKLKTGTVGPWACELYECTGDVQLQAFRKGAEDNLLAGLSMKNYFDVRQTLEEKVMRASGKGGGGGEGGKAGTTSSSVSGSLFNFGERAAQSQKAKMLAKLNTPHKRFEKKIKASMWMSEDFPLTLEHVTPMLEVLSMQDKVIHKLKEVLGTKGMQEAGFPAKVSLPLYLGVYAAVTFDNCKIFTPGELESELFMVNPQYSSSRRIEKGLFEGVMPGDTVLRFDGEGTPSSPTTRSTSAATTHSGASTDRKPSARQQQQQQQQQQYPLYKVWQPSDGQEYLQTVAAAKNGNGGRGSTRSSGGRDRAASSSTTLSVGSKGTTRISSSTKQMAGDTGDPRGRLNPSSGAPRERGRSSSRGRTGASPPVRGGLDGSTQPRSSSRTRRDGANSVAGGEGTSSKRPTPPVLADPGAIGKARRVGDPLWRAKPMPWAEEGYGGRAGEWEGGDSDDDGDEESSDDDGDEESSDDAHADDLLFRRYA